MFGVMNDRGQLILDMPVLNTGKRDVLTALKEALLKQPLEVQNTKTKVVVSDSCCAVRSLSRKHPFDVS